MRLNGKTAVVTGGASGIGQAICEAFVREGAAVAVLDVNGAAATAQAEALTRSGARAFAMEADVADEANVHAAIDAAAEKLGSLEILVNNAGIRTVRPFLEHSAKDFERQLGVNLVGAFNCSKAAVPHMIRNGRGKIINLASIASFVGRPDRVAYCATKAGVLGFTRAAAVDLRGKNICVNCIAPGMVATPFNAHHAEHGEFGPMWAQENAAGRWGRADDIANAAIYLASPESDYVSGADIKVDGAWLAFKARAGELEGRA